MRYAGSCCHASGRAPCPSAKGSNPADWEVDDGHGWWNLLTFGSWQGPLPGLWRGVSEPFVNLWAWLTWPDVSETAVDKYMIQHHKPASQAWRTSLDNHLTDIVAIDFFTVPTATCFPYWSDPLAIV